jgi:MFS family permease
MVQLTLYNMVLGLGCWYSSWALAGNNQTAPILEAKFGWDDSERKLWTSLIGNISVLGSALGSIFGGPLINKGRRWSMLSMTGVMVAATVLSLFRTIPTIMIGRFVQGIAAGVVNSAVAKSIFESNSTELYGVFGTATGTFMCLGRILCLLLGLSLPTNPELFESDETWRLTYAFPLLIAAVILVLQLCVYRYEPIDFSIKHGRLD